MDSAQIDTTECLATDQLRLQATALETVASAVVITDRDGTILWANPAFAAMTGYTVNEAIGQNPRMLKSGYHDPAFYRNLWQTILSGQTWRGEFINRCKDGRLYCGEQTITPVRSESGAITHFVAVMNDVTARKRTEEELVAAHEKIRHVLRHAPVLIYTLRLDGTNATPMVVSDNIERMLGITPTEACSYDWWLESLHPDDRERMVDLVARGMVAQGGYTAEYRVRHKDGSYRWIQDSNRVLYDAAGRPHEAVGVWTDVTEHKRWEAATVGLIEVAKAFSESLDLGVVGRLVTDGARRLLDASSAALYRVDPDSECSVLFAVSGDSERSCWGARLPAGMGLSAVVMRDGCPATTPDVVLDPRVTFPPELRARAEGSTLRARLVVPLLVRRRIGGFLAISDRTGQTFSERDVQLAQALADHAAIALENARLYEEAEQRRRVAEVMADLTRSISASLDADTVLRRVAEGARSLCGGDQAIIALWDASSEAVTCRYQMGTRESYAWQPVTRGKGSGGWVLATGLPFRTTDYANDPRITKDYLGAILRREVVTQMIAPIRGDGRIEGLLYVENRTPRPFTDRDEMILMGLANHASTALQNSQLFERERMARALAERAEENLRLLFTNGPLPMWVVDRETLQFLEVNETASAHYGYSREEFLAMSVTDIRPAEEVPRLLEFYAQNFVADRPALRQSGPWRHCCKDGRIIEIEAAAHPLEFAGRQALFVVVQDITGRRQLEAQLRQAQKMEAIGSLAGGIAHDFNNLLTVIGGRAYLMGWRMSPDHPLGADLEIIRKTTERAANLTRQILAFSRKQVLEPRVLDLNAVVTGIERMLRPLIGEQTELAMRLEPALWRVMADASQLEQVILNLALNARDAMRDGGRLLIQTKNVELDEPYACTHPDVAVGAYVMLAVSDTGHGMDAATQSHLFEPFFTTKEPGKGTGLGLATVYGIVKQSGGHIWAESEVGHGSTFTIHLPRVGEAAEILQSHGAAGQSIGGTETVLLTEDEQEVRRLTRETLELGGYTVLEARDPLEALRLAREHPGRIHLLLTDVVMPQMSGKALADRLVALRQETKVLFMSGYTADGIGHHGVLEPEVAFLQKPYTPETLARKVRDVLDRC